MNAAITVPNDLPAPTMEVIPAAMAGEAILAAAECQAVLITDAPSLERANALAVRIATIDKAIDAQGKSITQPLNQLLREVRGCIERAAGPVTAAKDAIKAKLGAWSREQARIAAEAQRKLDEEKRRLAAEAEAERARLQAEADAKAAREAKEMEALIGEPVALEPKRVHVLPAAPAPEFTRAAAPAAMATTAILTRKVPKLEIYDERACASFYEVAGVVLVDFKRSEIKRLIDAGVSIPGARVVIVEETAMRSAR